MSEPIVESPAEAYARGLLDAGQFLRGGMVGMRYGKPGEKVPAETVTVIVMEAVNALADALTRDAVKLGAANSPPPPGTLAAVAQGCRCAPTGCPLHG